MKLLTIIEQIVPSFGELHRTLGADISRRSSRDVQEHEDADDRDGENGTQKRGGILSRMKGLGLRAETLDSRVDRGRPRIGFGRFLSDEIKYDRTAARREAKKARKMGLPVRFPTSERRHRHDDNFAGLDDLQTSTFHGSDFLRQFLYRKRVDQSCALPIVLANGLDKRLAPDTSNVAGGIMAMLTNPLRSYRQGLPETPRRNSNELSWELFQE